MSLWLVGWMQGHLSRQDRLARALGRASYGAYVTHPLLVVSVSAALRSVPVVAEIKLVAVAAVGIVASFTLAWLLTRIPVTARIF